MVVKTTSLLDNYIDTHNNNGGRVGVWSLVVTIFGDCIEPRGGVFRLGALQQIASRIGIESNALRTAMSRLASDGWLERRRIGRASYYSPTAMASGENQKASLQIYHFPPSPWDGRWLFGVGTFDTGFNEKKRKALHACGFGFYGRKIAVAPFDEGRQKLAGKIPEIAAFETKPAQAISYHAFLANIEFQIDCTPHYAEFLANTEFLCDDVREIQSLDTLDAIALRCLLVHNWRRIVLKDVFWPHEARGESWVGMRARQRMKLLYQNLLLNSESWLDSIEGVPEGKLPKAEIDLALRFAK